MHPLLLSGLAYLVTVNLAGLLFMGIDKRRAVRGRRRVPERRLLFLAAVGGAAGTFIGMRVFAHKTRHLLFRLGLPVLILLQAILLLVALELVIPGTP